jgi:hypothetical protein
VTGLKPHLFHQQRPPFFALHILRLMIQTKATQTIGDAGHVLLTAVVLAEDRIGYRAPVPFWASELESVLGVKESALKRIRARCMEAGWLGFTARPKKSSLYWATVPESFRGMIEEGSLSSGGLGVKNDTQSDGVSKMTPQADPKRTASGLPSSPFPSPIGGGEGKEVRENPSPPGPEENPRDFAGLFAAIAEVTGLDPVGARESLQDATSRLGGTDPPFTAQEVREFARRFQELCPWARTRGYRHPTPGVVAKYCGLVRKRPAAKVRDRPRVQPSLPMAPRPEGEGASVSRLLRERGFVDAPEVPPPRLGTAAAGPVHTAPAWLEELGLLDARLTAECGTKPGHLRNLVFVHMVGLGHSSDMVTWSGEAVGAARDFAERSSRQLLASRTRGGAENGRGLNSLDAILQIPRGDFDAS